VLKPLFLFLILYIVLTGIFNVGKGIPHYAVYLLLGVVSWNFFTEATVIGASSVVTHGELIRKISIPRYLVVIASSVSALINLALSMVAVIILAFFNGLRPEPGWFMVPIIFLELFAFSMVIAFFLSAAYVKYRDISYIWEIILQAGFYASAILFPLQQVPEEYRKWFFLNPIVQMVQDIRYFGVWHGTITIWSKFVFPYVLYPFVVLIVVAVVAKLYFKAQSKYFAENI
jgi:ABC-2 type transport system permease protein